MRLPRRDGSPTSLTTSPKWCRHLFPCQAFLSAARITPAAFVVFFTVISGRLFPL